MAISREKVWHRDISPAIAAGHQEMLAAGRRHHYRGFLASDAAPSSANTSPNACTAEGRDRPPPPPPRGCPPSLSAERECFLHRPGRKTDPVGRHSVAVFALRTKPVLRPRHRRVPHCGACGCSVVRRAAFGRWGAVTDPSPHPPAPCWELLGPGGGESFCPRRHPRAMLTRNVPATLWGGTRRSLPPPVGWTRPSVGLRATALYRKARPGRRPATPRATPCSPCGCGHVPNAAARRSVPSAAGKMVM